MLPDRTGFGRQTVPNRGTPISGAPLLAAALAVLAVLCAAVLLAACGGSEAEPPGDERVAAIDPETGRPVPRGPMAAPPADVGALAFGHVSAPDGAVRELMFFRDGWMSEEPLPDPLVIQVEPTGDFLVPNLAPGHYYLIAYRGGGGWIDLVYIDELEHRQAVREVPPGDVAFLGTYGLVRPPTAGPMVMVPQRLPSERQLLQRLAERSRGTPWEGRIAERLAGEP